MSLSRPYLTGLLTAIALMLAACSADKAGVQPADDVLAQVGDSTLTLARVKARIPADADPADSARMATEIIECWLRDMLLRDMAEENVADMAKIDKMVSDYRNRLIVSEYVKLLSGQRNKGPKEADVKAYYDAHSDSLLLQRPLVKGVFLKVPDNAERIDDIRRWMQSASKQSIDRIEKNALKGATGYEYFGNRWADWQEIEAAIPYSFGPADALPADNQYFETTADGSVYLLHIYQTLPAGSVMPYDFAAPIIREMLISRDRDRYVEAMLLDVSTKAAKNGRLKLPGYDLKHHEVTIK